MTPSRRAEISSQALSRGGVLAASVAVCAAALAALLLTAAPASAARLAPAEGYGLVRDLLSSDRAVVRRAVGRLAEARDPAFVPAIVDALFFIPSGRREPALTALLALTGERRGRRYLDWVEYVGGRTDLEPAPGYAGWKGSLLARIDRRFGELIHDGVARRVRLEEIVWGGVRFEGIPALDRPRHVTAAEAGYLADADLVFGVSAGGEHRAYPRRIVSWHEMVNDVVGGEPVTLSYCTLCGSAVLYSGRAPDGQILTFGTSGLLYRSNKLMVDRSTGTLWLNLTGEAVVGPLAAPGSTGPGGGAAAGAGAAGPGEDQPARLTLLPVALTTWGAWRARHPDTTVLALEPERARRWGFDYSPGAADKARAGVSFPVWRKSDRLDPEDEVYALRLGGSPKAYPVAAVAAEGVVDDAVGGEPVVLVAEPASGAIRAYRRGAHRFRRPSAEGSPPAPGEPPRGDRLEDERGRPWRLTEEALVPPDGSGEPVLERLPGHRAFWFGWYGFFPQTAVYEGPGTEGPPAAGPPPALLGAPVVSGSQPPSRAREPGPASRRGSSRALPGARAAGRSAPRPSPAR